MTQISFNKCKLCGLTKGKLCYVCSVKKSSSEELDGMVERESQEMTRYQMLKKRFEERQKKHGKKSKLNARNLYLTM